MSEPIFEIADESAVAETVKVNEAAFFEWDGSKDLAKNAESWRETLSRRQGAFLAIARVEGQIVAFVLGYDGTEPHSFFIALMGGLPETRGRGIGRGLFRFALTEIERRGYEVVDINTLNRYRGMLTLCITEDFDIVDFRFDQGRKCNRIYLRRVFAPHDRP
jgi:ribosomal protein S18 acetylase RimI-like enzyme